MAERLQKLLATAGVASRRASEALILSGRVTVNGRAVRELGAKADPTDDIRVDGQKLRPPTPQMYILLYKPPGYTSTVSDPHAARTVMELLPPGTGRVFPAGRLDRESEGLLLLTDDGALTQRLLHPSFHLPKEYAVLVRGRLTEVTLRRLRGGTVVEGRRTAPVEVEPTEPPRWAGAGPPDTMWLRFVLREGRKRQIRETCAEAGVSVERLIRTRMGPLALGTLPPGKTRRLTPHEIASLRRACGLEVPEPVAAPAADPARARTRTPAPAGHPGNAFRGRTPSPAPGRAATARAGRGGPGGDRRASRPPAAPPSPRMAPAGRGAARPEQTAPDADRAGRTGPQARPDQRGRRAPQNGNLPRPSGTRPGATTGRQRPETGEGMARPAGLGNRGAGQGPRAPRAGTGKAERAQPPGGRRTPSGSRTGTRTRGQEAPARKRGGRVSGRAPHVPEALVRAGARPKGVRRPTRE